MFKSLKNKLATTINDQIVTDNVGVNLPEETTSATASSVNADSPAKSAHSNGLGAEEQARLEATPRADLIDQLVKQKISLNRRKKRLVDLVEAYKAMATEKEKLEEALEKQQDAAAKRSKEQSSRHKADTVAKDKLIAALKQRLEDADGKNKELLSGLEAAASNAATLQDRLADSARGQEQDDVKFDEIQQTLRESRNLITKKDQKITDLSSQLAHMTQRSEELQLLIRQKDVDLLAQTERASTLRASLKTRDEPQGELGVKLQTAAKALEDKEAALAAAVKRRVDLEARVNELTTQLREQSATSKRALASAESSGNRKIEMLQKDLDRATAAAATREDELNRKLDAALRDARRLKQQNEEENDSHSRTMANLENEISTLRTRAQAPSPNHQDSADGHVQQALQASRLQSEDLRAQLSRQKDVATRQIQQLTDKTTNLQTEINQATELLASQKKKCTEAESRAEALESSLDSVQERHRATSESLEHVQMDLQQLELRNAAVLNDLQSERVKADAQQQLISTLERTISEKESLYTILKNSNDDLNTRLIAKSEEVIAAGAESSALRIQLETESHAARTTKEKATQEREEFETIIESLKTKVSTLREELVTAKEISADAKRVADSEKVKCREATAAMKALELKLSRTENSSTAAADQVSELSSNVELLQRDLGTANDRIKAESARAMAVEGDHGRVVAKCEKLEGRVHELQTQLDAVHERLKKEQATSASFQYTAQTKDEALQAACSRRDELEKRCSTLSQDLSVANAQLDKVQSEAEVSQADVEKLSAEVCELKSKVSTLNTQMTNKEEQLSIALEKCEQLASDTVSHTAQIASLSADLASEITVKETQDILIAEQREELSVLREKNEAHAAEVEALRTEREDLSNKLSATVEQHQRATKLQQQHAAELKRTLQKSLKGQISASDYDALSPSAPSRALSGESTPQSALASGQTSPSTGRTRFPDELETNMRYLRNVVLKYMTGRRAETRHLVMVIGTMLQFSKEEIDTVHKTVDEATSSWLNWN
eukprot:m.138667 g.138667  ORF g.138667 m.138667 type:complete len:1023 (+) comp14003_c0_seq1:579-3647(+)